MKTFIEKIGLSFLVISAPEEFTPQAEPDKLTGQVPDKFSTDSPRILQLIKAQGNDELTVKEMLSQVGLKHRETFLANYLNPAIKDGFVRLLYPDSPRPPPAEVSSDSKGFGGLSGTSALKKTPRKHRA